MKLANNQIVPVGTPVFLKDLPILQAEKEIDIKICKHEFIIKNIQIRADDEGISSFKYCKLCNFKQQM